MRSHNVPWAEYTGSVSPFGDIKPCWCAWHNELPIFLIKLVDQGGSWVGAIGGEQIQSPGSLSLESAQARLINLASVGWYPPTDISRAHILNFQKKG